MELTTVSCILCFIATFVYYIYRRGKPKEGAPLGPWRLPYIGNGHQMGTTPHRIMSKWAKEYGPIYSVQFGTMECIVLSDVKLAKEALANPTFSGKPDQDMFNVFSKGKYGIIWSDGHAWTEQRRFTLRQLRDFGFGKKVTMEPMIMEEVNEIISWLKNEEGTPVNMAMKLKLAVLNSLWMLVHGKRYQHDDPRLHEFFQSHHDAMETVSKSGFIFLIPWLSKLIPNISGWNKLWKVVNTFHSFFHESVVEHQATIGDDPRDFLDAYLHEMKAQAKSPDSSFNEKNGMNNLMAVITDLFLAGFETTSMTLSWLFLYLSVHPKVLRKIHNEIDSVVGKSRQPSLADRPNMIYTEAVLNEVLRYSSIAPVGAFHSTLETFEFHNYKIEKGCLLVANLHFIHFNPEIWGDPENFRPERFLSEDGKSLVKNENLMAFSTGKRVCLGESLARDELFLFATSICQRFDITVDPQCPNPSLEPDVGFMLQPQPYSVIMRDRL